MPHTLQQHFDLKHFIENGRKIRVVHELLQIEDVILHIHFYLLVLFLIL